jgi:hypothetical protein
MSDWALVAAAGVTGVAAVIGGGIGYLTARRQTEVELQRISAENERLKLAHGEEHLRHRQAVYHDFLDTAFKFHQARGDVDPFSTPDEYRQWAHLFEHRLTAVSLFGTEAAWLGAQKLADVMEEALEAKSADDYSDNYEPTFSKLGRSSSKRCGSTLRPTGDPRRIREP